MKKQVLSMIGAAALSLPLYAADTYTLDSRHTWPVFEINHLGFSTQRGRFNKTTGKVTLDRAAKKGAIDIVIDTASIDMGLEKWDEHMRSDDYFNTAKFPTMTFKSDKLTFEGDELIAAEGSFTLLGVTKPLKVTVTNFRCADHPMVKKPACGADVSTSIKRSEFGMTKGLPAIGDVVKIVIPVEAIKD